MESRHWLVLGWSSVSTLLPERSCQRRGDHAMVSPIRFVRFPAAVCCTRRFGWMQLGSSPWLFPHKMSLPTEIWLGCQRRVIVKHVIEIKNGKGNLPLWTFLWSIRSLNSQFKWRKERFGHSMRGTWSSSTEELSKYWQVWLFCSTFSQHLSSLL